MVAYLCRYGNQDAHRLLGVKRLTPDQMFILATHIGHLLEAEVEPLAGDEGSQAGDE